MYTLRADRAAKSGVEERIGHSCSHTFHEVGRALQQGQRVIQSLMDGVHYPAPTGRVIRA